MEYKIRLSLLDVNFLVKVDLVNKNQKNMKPIKKPFAKSSQKPQCVSVGKSSSSRIHITLVSEKERDIYRISSYGYVLQ